MTRTQPTVFTVQFLMARVASLEAAGDKLARLLPSESAVNKRALKVWSLTKEGGKRADKK